MTVRNVRLTVEYDGTAYAGWQVQPNASTLQGEMERVLSRISGHPVDLLVAGRTDAGVHALGQVCSFKTASKLPAREIARVANQLLPPDIRIAAVRDVPGRFHATYDALSKLYRYVLNPSREKSVFDRFYHQPERRRLDLRAMRKAARMLAGTHDFSAFKGPSAKGAKPVRTLLSVNVRRRQGRLLLEFHGESFLHQMVRILSGTLLYVGLGKIRPSDIPRILAGKDRRRAGPTLPSKGLFLVRVFYPRVIGKNKNKKTLDIDAE